MRDDTSSGMMPVSDKGGRREISFATIARAFARGSYFLDDREGEGDPAFAPMSSAPLKAGSVLEGEKGRCGEGTSRERASGDFSRADSPTSFASGATGMDK